MASSSSFASDSQYSCPRWKYDVFLSFRGADTRRTFTGHLYEGLKNRGIFTFQDDKRLEKGDSIPEELLKAIEESQVALVIFSKNYATSRWCLNELVKIMECKEEKGQRVIPVFYDVYASEVRHQTESFAEAFVKHESKYINDVEGMKKVNGWRTALSNAADLKGCNIHDRIESECIRELVDDLSSKLCKTCLSYCQDIVGIDNHLEEVNSLLEMEINDVRIMGIWGIGGVGKTTIAKAIFDTLSDQFKAACFLADVKENARKNQLHSLQNTLLSELLRKKDDYVNNKYDGKSMIQSRLCSMKVLIVVDDIDHGDQLEYLAGDVCWFGNGSRIVVTTRNRHLIEKDDAIYEVPTLPDHEAMQLFNQHAFKKEVPDERFKKLSLEVVNHAKGLPLALKVWGSLFHKKGLTQWRGIVDQIKKNSNSEIVEKLKISYDGLEPEEQKIFLDIACFFRGHDREKVMEILESCDFGAEYGLDVLIDKSLVFLTEYDKIEMHDLIEDMGKYLVKMQKDSGKQSRIWNVEDFEDVMVDTTRIVSLEAIWYNASAERLWFSKNAMNNMQRLRILRVSCMHFYPSHSPSDIPYGSIEYLPNSVCWFEWYAYPWKSLPENFKPQRLVHLQLKFSSLHELWTKNKILLPSLQRLDLEGSKILMETPDFTVMPNLEYLNLSGCTSVKKVHHSLGCSNKLIHLYLNDCKSLERFPCVNEECLQVLSLRGCSRLEKFPEIFGRMKPKLDISVEQYFFYWYIWLDLSSLKNLVALPRSIGLLKNLVKLNLSGCSKFESLPEEIGDLENLEKLDASYTLISRPPSSIVRLNKLKLLTFAKEESEDRVYFVFPRVNEGLRSLEKLDLSYCNLIDGGLPEDIGSLSSLKKLYLKGNNFEHLPPSIGRLGYLRSLDLSECRRLKEFIGVNVAQGLYSLENLNLSYCNLIDGGLPEDIGCLSSLKQLNLKGNNFEHMPQSIGRLGALRSLDLSDCKRLTQLPELPQQLDTINADWSNDLICNMFAYSLFQNISFLHSFSVRNFTFEHHGKKIPSWFHHRGTGKSVSVNLPENWYRDNFLEFTLCYSGNLIETKAYLIPLCNRMSWMIQNLSLSNHSKRHTKSAFHFFFVPLASMWDTSKANGKTPNDYGFIGLYFSGEIKDYGFRLLYKDELKHEVFLQMRGDNDEPTEHSIGTRRSRYDEASCSSSKKQRSVFENLQQQVEAPDSPEILQLFPTGLDF